MTSLAWKRSGPARRLLYILLLAIAASSAAAAPPDAPILRIETGMHGAAVNALAVTPDGKALISASDDKTARIWSLEDGKLLHTLRGPIGEGPEGALYALALSPSGKTIAVAGYTGITEGGAAIYLFNRETGAWIGRISIGSQTDSVTALAFSPDGGRLAVGINDSRGVRMIDLNARRVEPLDPDAAAATTGLSYGADGRLVTASADGKIRLYDSGLKRVAERDFGAEAKPFSVAFSPDGMRIAVGFLSAAKVALLGSDLEPMGELTGAPGRRGTLGLVAWSIDGQRLYAAGTYGESGGRKQIRRWPSFGGSPADLPAGNDTVTALAPLGNGGIAFANAEPRWGVFDASDRPGPAHQAAQVDLRDTQRQFLVSSDGGVVEFGIVQGGAKRARFDLGAGSFEIDPPARADLKPPAEGKAGGWRNTAKPTIGGKPVFLDANEIARSVASLGEIVVLGTDFFVRRYEGTRLVWKTAVNAPAWAVNVSADKRWAIVGTGDGTIRWLRLDDGSERLALFAKPSGEWVVWTPEGFFDHAPGGERLIGYHLNRVSEGTARGAAFVRVEQLYSLFSRRDVVMQKFRGDDAAVAAQLAMIGDINTVLGRGLPPLVRISEWCTRERGLEQCDRPEAEQQARSGTAKLQPIRVSSPDLVVRVEVEDRGGGQGPIVLRRQGAQVAAEGGTRAISGKTRIEERVVQLEPGLNVISLSAFNAAKEIETDTTERAALAVEFVAPQMQQPVLRVLAVGIDNYRSPAIEKLSNAAADARGIVKAFEADQSRRVFRDLDAQVLIDDQATLAGITAALEQLAARTRPEDVAVLFLAGHSVALNGKFFFLPHDLSRPSPEAIQNESMTHDKLAALLAKLPSSRAMLILDSCFSGAFAVEDSVLRESRDQTMGRQMSHASGRFILAASSSYEEALDGEEGHGVLTSTILDGLAGSADRHVRGNRDGKVSVLEIGEWAKARVPQVSARLGRTRAQQPRWYFTGDEMFDLRGAEEIRTR